MSHLALALSMLACASLSVAQQPLPAQQPPSQQPAPPVVEQLVALRGRVVAAETAEPLRGARVTVIAAGRSQDPVFTDGRGAFDARVPVSSAYSLSVAKAGFVTSTASPPAARASGRDATFEIALARGGAIAGSVRDQSGKPVPNVRVRVHRVASSSTSVSPAADVTSQTDDLGEYRIGGLAAGRYTVRAFGSATESSVFIRGQTTSALDLERVKGAVEDTLAPDDVTVQVTGGETASITHSVSASQRMSVAFDPSGKTAVAFLSADPSAVKFLVADLSTTVVKGGIVTGTVLDAFGDPVEGAAVELRPFRIEGGRGTLTAGIGTRRTDDRGRFRLFNVPAGSYYLALTGLEPEAANAAAVYYPGRSLLSDAVAISVEDEQELAGLDLTFAVLRTARIRGVVLDAAGQQGLTGGVTLAARIASGIVSLPVPEASIARDGSFEIPRVAPGDYILQAVGKGSSGVREFGLAHVNMTGVDLDSIVVSTSSGSRVTGRVAFEGSAPTVRVPSLGLSVSPADPAYGPMVTVYTGGFVGDDGRFDLIGLVGPGRFALEGAPNGWWLKSVTIGGVDVTDAPVTFDTGEHNAAVVIATTGGRIEGRITSDSECRRDDRIGRVSAGGICFWHGVSVAVFPSDASRWFYRSRHLRLVRVAPDGSFSVSGLPPGEYWVAATATGFEEGAYGSWQHPEFFAGLRQHARLARLEEGRRTAVDLALAR